MALHNGNPLIGQRVTDVFSVLDFIASETSLRDKPIRFIAKGSLAPVALHAAFLDRRISKLELDRDITPWKHYLDNPLELNQLSQVIPGVLQYYDLPDLLKLLKGSVSIVNN
jgi:hypothetical protein